MEKLTSMAFLAFNTTTLLREKWPLEPTITSTFTKAKPPKSITSSNCGTTKTKILLTSNSKNKSKDKIYLENNPDVAKEYGFSKTRI